MKLKIIGDGTPYGTRVVDAETGEPLEGVYQVAVVHRANDVPRATIGLYSIPLEIVAGDLRRYELTNEPRTAPRYHVPRRPSRRIRSAECPR